MIRDKYPAKIFISDLPERCANEGFLFSFFQKCGRIIPNGISIHYNPYQNEKEDNHFYSAFVSFETIEEAKNARQKLNYTEFDNVPINITLADPETNQIRISGKGFINVQLNDSSIKVGELEKIFSKYGEVIFCSIKGQSNYRDGMVQFREVKNACRAVQELKCKEINGKKTYMYIAHKYNQNSNEFINVCYIENIPESIRTEEDLRYLFAQYGKVIYASLPKNYNGKNKGFAFCTFDSAEEVERASHALNGKIIDGNEISCRQYMSTNDRNNYLCKKYTKESNIKYEKNKDKILFFRNFDKDVSEDDLEYIFQQFGEVECIDLLGIDYNPYGFVHFKRKEDAEKCLDMSFFIFIRGKQLFVSKYVKDRSNMSKENKKALISILHEMNRDNDRTIKSANQLSEYQAKYLIDNQHFIFQWIENANLQ